MVSNNDEAKKDEQIDKALKEKLEHEDLAEYE